MGSLTTHQSGVRTNSDSETPAPVGAPTEPKDEMLTKPELAAKLKICLRTVENWIQAGHLPYLKISHLVLFYWPDVVCHLKANFGVRPGGETAEAENGTNGTNRNHTTKASAGRNQR